MNPTNYKTKMFNKKKNFNLNINSLVVQSVKNQQQKLKKNAIKFEVALREQNYLQNQLQNIQKQKEYTKIPEDDKAILQKKEIQQLKKQLEHITKNFNTISSNNQKKRNHINTLRKERTLYDHIFKTLEYQILNEENQLIELLKKNQKDDKHLQKQEEELKKVKNLTIKNKQRNFSRVLLLDNMDPNKNKSLLKQKSTNNQEFEQEMEKFSELYQVEKNKTQNLQQHNVLEAYELQEKRLFFLEQLKSDFGYYTNGTDIDFLETYMQNGQQQNDDIYNNYCLLEHQLQEIIKYNKKAQKEIELCQVKENNQKKTEDTNQQNLIEKNKILEGKVCEQVEKLNNITVFQIGYISKNFQKIQYRQVLITQEQRKLRFGPQFTR